VGVVGTFIGCLRSINVFNLLDGMVTVFCSCGKKKIMNNVRKFNLVYVYV
jgi:hypothetical protein